MINDMQYVTPNSQNLLSIDFLIPQIILNEIQAPINSIDYLFDMGDCIETFGLNYV